MEDTRLVSRATELMEADLGDEIVALDVNQGLCFGLNAPAASVWRLLEQPRSLRDLHGSLVEEYDVDDEQCLADLTELLADMETKGLISIR